MSPEFFAKLQALVEAYVAAANTEGGDPEGAEQDTWFALLRHVNTDTAQAEETGCVEPLFGKDWVTVGVIIHGCRVVAAKEGK